MATPWKLYIRQGCHLCDAFLVELAGVLPMIEDSLTLIDIDEREEDRLRFGDKVPVLFHGDTEICCYFFDPDKVHPYLKPSVNSLK